ncbi:hypothetical protein Btru_026893 [Bulinus truncatus]|nr:hypothetical protein Btru_026893 [Bulinus truncatus]
MYHLIPFTRHQVAVNLTLRRFLSVAASCQATPTTDYQPKNLQRKSFANASCEGFEPLSRSQASGVWKSLQIINSTLNQVQSGSRSDLISKYSSHTNQNLPSQAVLLLKESFLDENQNLNGAKVYNKFPDNYTYLANSNSCLNKIHDGLLSNNIKNVLHLEQLFRPQLLCSHKFHTTTSICGRSVPLIHYNPPKEALGLTYISDLSEEDVEKLRKFAHEDFKTILKLDNIKASKAKPKRRTFDHGVFGTSLEALVHKDIKKNLLTISDKKVPAVFSMFVKYFEKNGLKVEGIFREPGAPDRIERFRANLTDNFYKNPNYSINDVPNITVHDVAQTFKAFLRELPTSIVSSDRFEVLPDLSSLPMEVQIKATNLFIITMHVEYRDSLLVFLNLMNSVLLKQNLNKMNNTELAACMTSCTFAMPEDYPDLESSLKYYEWFKILANYNNKLFVVPHKLLHQVRQKNDDKAGPKGRNYMDPQLLMSKVETDISVHPLEGKQQTYKIDTNTTAKDIVEKAGVAKMDYYLHEVGGNIGERCLDPDTLVLEVYRANPYAKWMIKHKKGR